MGQAQQVIQQLTIHLTGGQTVKIQFNAGKPDVFNLQIEAFLSALNDKSKQESSFLFEGAHVVLVRISEVAAAEVMSFIRSIEQAPSFSPPTVPDQDANQPLETASGPSEHS